MESYCLWLCTCLGVHIQHTLDTHSGLDILQQMHDQSFFKCPPRIQESSTDIETLARYFVVLRLGAGRGRSGNISRLMPTFGDELYADHMPLYTHTHINLSSSLDRLLPGLSFILPRDLRNGSHPSAKLGEPPSTV